MQYAQWSALYFAIKNGDQRTVDFLVANEATTSIKDQASVQTEQRLTISQPSAMQYGHTPLSYSKGLFLQRKVQMYKHLVQKLFPEVLTEEETRPSPVPRSATPMVTFRAQLMCAELKYRIAGNFSRVQIFICFVTYLSQYSHTP